MTDSQTRMAKQKKHDCLEDMGAFSKMWKDFPILYDESARNKLFSQDYGAALEQLNKSYLAIAEGLNLTVAEVKACRIKYRDSVTKAVKQYGDDLRNGTSTMPTAAATKLSVFNWLLPFSCHYDAAIMADKPLDQYLEHTLHGHANRLECNKQDCTEVCATLSRVSTYLCDVAKPWKLVLEVIKLNWDVLATATLKDGLSFLHGYTAMTVFEDESVSCECWESFCLDELHCTVSDWLSHNIDPTFKWAEAGMHHFSLHVTVSTPVCEGKMSVIRRADAMALALNRCGTAAREARFAVDKAQNSETLFNKSFCYGYALSGCGGSVTAAESAKATETKSATLHVLMDDIVVVIEKVMQLEAACAKLCAAPMCVVSYKPSLLRSLEAVRANLKLYSSQFWNLPKCP